MELMNGLIGLAAMGIWAWVFMTLVDKVIIGEKVLAEIRKDKKDSI